MLRSSGGGGGGGSGKHDPRRFPMQQMDRNKFKPRTTLILYLLTNQF
jgi:hypothetical protein